MIRVVLVYPNICRLGISNLGFQTVYKLLNQTEDVICEQAFLPEKPIRKKGHLLRTIESGWHLRAADIVAFSISFENDYLHLLTILENAGIPLFSCHRGDEYPLIIAGGIATFLNPEPISPFADCFLLGEAEAVLPCFLNLFDPAEERNQALKRLARQVPGLYVPRFYTPMYHPEGMLSGFEPTADIPSQIRRIFVKDLSDSPPCSTELLRNTAFGDIFLMEVSRGCPHGCRFCSAGYVYRPPRFTPLPLLREYMAHGMAISKKIGLVGAAVSDLPGLADLCLQAYEQGVSISFSSLRADALTPEILSALRQSRVKTATIAPDAGSQRLRDVINKGLDEDVLLHAAEMLVANDIPNLKLYFMIGLPTETPEDIEAIVQLCKAMRRYFLKSSRKKGHMGEITVSLSSFVPKPFTPFQWAEMAQVHSLKAKIRHVRAGLKRVPNLRVHADIPTHAHVQALLSRGDRRVADLLIQAHINQGNWAQTLKETPLDMDAYLYRERRSDEMLPWAFIDQGIDKSFLYQEYLLAKQEKLSLPCPKPSDASGCSRCGACRMG